MRKLVLPRPHEAQARFIFSSAKRRIVCAGRRSGKTYGVALAACLAYLNGRRVLYAAPTSDQTDAFWSAVTDMLRPMLTAKAAKENKTERSIEGFGRVRAKTAWSADGLRGDWADMLILDEYQLMDETAWGEVGAPMLADRDGDAIFIFTPPSLHSRSASKARDKRHAVKFIQSHRGDKTGRWAEFTFTSRDNPHISQAAVDDLAKDMTTLSYRQEILAEIIEEAPGALWKLAEIEKHRVTSIPALTRVVAAVDPSASSGGDECGIVVAGLGEDGRGYVLEDCSLQASPDGWAKAAVAAYHRHKADRMIAESNQGGEMVRLTIGTVQGAPPVTLIHASRGKQARAEPVAAQYEQGKVSHLGEYPQLEGEYCGWEPGTGQASPNRLDAAVYALTELMPVGGVQVF
jgi:hypothetical protein